MPSADKLQDSESFGAGLRHWKILMILELAWGDTARPA